MKPELQEIKLQLQEIVTILRFKATITRHKVKVRFKITEDIKELQEILISQFMTPLK